VKLMIVHRDGILGRDAHGRASHAHDWQSAPGSAQAVARLNHGGWHVAVLADRGPLARGACDMAALGALHAQMIDDVTSHGGRIDLVLYAAAPDAPRRAESVAATLEDALARLGVAPSAAVVVSDARAELDAARVAGCQPILVLSGHGRETLDAGQLPPGTLVRVDLAAVAAELAP
jgi:D-glycero-D-manno-heptose 1,7-bisphosphate phosphatase